jgi:hypothetical protein
MAENGKKYGYNGHAIGVVESGDQYVAAWVCDTGRLHRIVSKYLKSQDTAEEMQERLDAWAKDKRLDEISPAPAEGLTKEDVLSVGRAFESMARVVNPGREVPLGGLTKGMEYAIKRRGAAKIQFFCAEYRGVTDGFHEFFSTDFGCGKRLFSSAALVHYEIHESLK